MKFKKSLFALFFYSLLSICSMSCDQNRISDLKINQQSKTIETLQPNRLPQKEIQPQTIPSLENHANNQSKTKTQPLTINKLVGTWESKVLNTNEVFYFCIYPNFRTYAYGNNWSRWETFEINGTTYCSFDIDTKKNTFCSAATFFDGKKWKYQGIGTGDNFLAKKIYSEPKIKNIASHMPVADAQFSDDIMRELQDRNKHKIRYEPCVFCSGAGKEQCNICGGHGGSRIYSGINDHIGQWIDCSGSIYPCIEGKTKCHMCDGTGINKIPK
jgi:hypothetical protein